MTPQVVRTLAWDFHPCPFLWTNNPAGYSAVAGSIIITVSSALVPLRSSLCVYGSCGLSAGGGVSVILAR